MRIQTERIRALGLQLTYEECVRELLGVGMPSPVRRLEEWLGRPRPDGWQAELEAEVEAAFRRELRPVPGIVEALDEIPRAFCTASSGSHQKMTLTLGLTGLYERF